MKERKCLVIFLLAFLMMMCLPIQINAAGKKNIITGFEENKEISNLTYYENQKPLLKDILKEMPTTLKAFINGDNKYKEIDVEWKCVGDNYDESDDYYYQFIPKWSKNYKLNETLVYIKDTPYISVSIMPKNGKGKISSVSGNGNETTIYNYLKNNMGLNTAAACGVLANIKAESSFNPNATGDKGTSYGICQWHDTSTGVGRWTNLKKYCNNNGYSWTSLNGQLHYLQYELSTSGYNYIYNYLKKVSNNNNGAYDAAYYWCYYFEVPADKANVAKTRGNLAKNTYWSYYGGTPVPVTPPKGSQIISDGDYHIVSALDNSYGLNVAYNSKDSGANIQLHNKMGDSDSLSVVTVKHLGNGYYKLTMKNSGKVLDVKNASGANGANVWQYNDNGSAAQQWIIKDAGNGYFYIISKRSGMYMEVAGGRLYDYANVQMYTGNSTTAQKWKFIAWGAGTGQTIKNGNYRIVSALNPQYCIDVADSSLNSSANIHLYENTNSSSQVFQVTYLRDGFYKIICKKSGKLLDVQKGGVVSGTNVWQYNDNGSSAQLWIIKDVGNGYYSIVSKQNGLYLDVQEGKVNNKCNIQVYLSNNTDAQKWAFIPERANKITFDMQGGKVEGSFATYTSQGINVSRSAGSLVIFSISGQKVNTNKYGVEAKVDSTGKVTQKREYGSETAMTVPNGGFIVSGHVGNTASNDGSRFTKKLSVGQYVGYDEKTLLVSAYKDIDSYLIENKYVDSGSKYGSLPVPTREGYDFDGWYTEESGGTKVTENSVYTNNTLYAHWNIAEKPDQIITGTETYSKTYGDESFVLNAALEQGDGELSYKSDDENVVKIDSAGKVTIIGSGKANIAVTASETDNYKSTFTVVSITIVPKEITSNMISDIPDQEYTGEEIKPDVEVNDNHIKLALDKDYTLQYANNKEITQSNFTNLPAVTIIGCGNYTGSVVKNFRIIKAKCSHEDKSKIRKMTTKATLKENGCISEECLNCGEVLSKSTIYYPKEIILSKTNYVYNGKVQKPSVIIKGADGKDISTKNYTLSYAKGRKNVGKYSIKITFKGNYSGSISKTFTIVPKGTKISRLTASSKGFIVKWIKQSSQTTGYQIQYSINSKFTGAKLVTISKNKTVTKKVTKLVRKKKYYVRIRTYKTVSGTKYYSGWSPVKSIVTKR